MNNWTEIKHQLKSGDNPVIQLIAWNAGIFLLSGLLNLLLFLTGSEQHQMHHWLLYLMLPASFAQFILQPWSLFTYLFLHDHFFHILFNMLWLYWLGGLLWEYLGKRKFLESYFGGGIFGGMIYMLLFNLIPAFDLQLSHTYALGASASVLAVVVAAATLLPDYTVQLLFFGRVRLKWIALASVVIDLISIPNGNAGGHLAHLGGALFGFMYIRFLYKFGGYLVPDKVYQLFRKKQKIRIHHKADSHSSTPSQHEIDAILDKISRSGYDSLTKKEKETLFKASKH